MRKNRLAPLFIILLLSLSSSARAWTGNGNQIRSGSGTLEQIDAVSDGAGGSYICWADRRSGNYDVYLSRVDAGGSLMSGWTANGTVVCNLSGDQKSPRLLPDGSNGVYIAWQDSRPGTNGSDIYLTRFTGSGTPAASWPANGIAICAAAAGQMAPAIAATSDGNLVVAWLDFRTTGVPYYYAQKISPSATALWAANGVQASTVTGITTNFPPSIASDGQAGVFFAYATSTPLKGYVERLNGGTGSRMFQSTVQVSSQAVTSPPVLASDGGVAVIAAYAAGSDIQAARFDGGGTATWTFNVCTATGEQLMPQIVRDGQGGAIVAWGDRRIAGETDLYAQRVTSAGALGAGWVANGKLVAAAIAPVATTAVPGNGLSFTMTTDGNTQAGARFAWAQGSPLDIYGTSIDYSGNVGATQALCADYPNVDQNSPVVAYTTSGGVVAWRDTRAAGSTNTGVYAGAAISGICSATSAPGPVSSGPFNSANCYSYHLSWNAPTSGGLVDQYVVTNTTTNVTYPPVGWSSTSIDIPNLQANTTYNFNVVARNCFGASGPTGIPGTTSSSCPNAATAVNVTTNPLYGDQVSVTWQYTQGTSNPATGLRIYWRYLQDHDSHGQILEVPGLPPQGSGNTTYSFNVPEYEGEVAIVPYITVSGSTYEYPPDQWVAVRTPNTPIVPLASETNYVAPQGDQNFADPINLIWYAGRNARSFDLEIASSSNFDPSSPGYQLITGIPPNDLTFTYFAQSISGLVQGTTYYARLNAYSTRGEVSGWSASHSFRLLGLRITSPVTGVTWTYGQQQTIQWQPSTTVKVELFPNPTIVVDHLTGNSTVLSASASGTSLTVNVPYMATTQARLQISRVVNGATEYAYSPVPFTITVPSGNGNAIKVGPGVVTDQPQIVPDGAGGSYVCWSDNSNGSDNDVFVARLNSSKTLMSGWPIDITPGQTGDQFEARIAADGGGGVYVAWQDEHTGFSNADIYAIHLNSSGATVSGWGAAAPTFGGIAVCSAGNRQAYPNVAIASDGALLVGWADSRAQYTYVYAQKLSAAGAPQWTAGGVQVSESGLEDNRPSLASDGAGGAFAAYASGYAQAYVQKLNAADGSRVLSLWQSEISSLTSNTPENAPAIINDGGTGAIVEFLELSNPPHYVSDMAAVHVDQFGYQNWYQMICNTTGNPIIPSLVPDGAGGAVLAWVDGRVAGVRALYAARLLMDGTSAPGWPANGLQIAPSIYSYFERLALAPDGLGGATFAWAVSPGDIYSRGVSGCGTLGATTTLCADGLEQNVPAIAVTASGSATVSWRDSRGAGTNTGVFAAGVATPVLTAPTLAMTSGTYDQGLSWAGPAGDLVYGLPASFDIRTSNAAINDQNWSSATEVANVPVNGPPGTAYCMVIESLQSCTTYFYAIRTTYSNCSMLSTPVTSVSQKTKCSGNFGVLCDNGVRYEKDSEDAPPLVLDFSRPRPSPARDATWFDLAVPSANDGEEMTLTIHDLLGRRIREVLHERARVGRRAVEWRLDTDAGTRVPRGVYFARLKIGNRVFNRTVIAQP